MAEECVQTVYTVRGGEGATSHHGSGRRLMLYSSRGEVSVEADADGGS